jgi:hypothetical protein
MQAVTEDKIQVRAYELWEMEGRPFGRAEEFWFRATTELSTNGAVKKAKKPAAPKAAASAKSKAVAEPVAKPKKKAASKKSN